jgi:riboflavin kinase / FMN adenylyltransferase
VALKSFRRPERRFGSLGELKKQLDLDIADGRNA